MLASAATWRRDNDNSVCTQTCRRWTSTGCRATVPASICVRCSLSRPARTAPSSLWRQWHEPRINVVIFSVADKTRSRRTSLSMDLWPGLFEVHMVHHWQTAQPNRDVELADADRHKMSWWMCLMDTKHDVELLISCRSRLCCLLRKQLFCSRCFFCQ